MPRDLFETTPAQAVTKQPRDLFEAAPQADPMVGSMFGKVKQSDYDKGERNVLGNVFERPAAAVRSAIQGKGYAQGATNPGQVPTFQQLALDKFAPKTRSATFNAVFGMPASAAGLAADIATNPADMLFALGGKLPTGGGTTLGGRIAATKPAQMLSKITNAPLQKIPQVVRQEAQMATGFESKVSGRIKNLDKQIKEAVGYGIDKGIKPTVLGKKTIGKNEQFRGKVAEAVKDIVINKDRLQFADDAGRVTSRLPESNNEWAQAIAQRKKDVYSQYSKIAQEAGEQGASFDTNRALKELQRVVDSKSYSPDIRAYASKQIDNVLELQGASPDVIDARISELNGLLEGYYRGTVNKPQADVLASVAKVMRNELDETISKTTGKPFQALKNKYGALKAAEKEINHRAVVTARQAPKSLADLTDIFSGERIVRGTVGLMTGNPYAPADIAAGVSMNLLKRGYKAINNPDRAVKQMFRTVERLMGKTSALEGLLPPMKEAELVTQMPFLKQKALPPSVTKAIEYKPSARKMLGSDRTYGEDFSMTPRR